MHKFVATILLLLSAPLTALAFPDKPTAYVTDLAEILRYETEVQVATTIDEFKRTTGHEIAVLTVPTLEGIFIEQYAVMLFESWGIGGKQDDNGVLLLIAPTEHKVRIEVGYGLEGALPDALAAQIINTSLTPKFKEGNYDDGVVLGVDAIIAAIKDEKSTTVRKESLIGSIVTNNLDFFVMLGNVLFIFVISILTRSSTWWLGGAMGGIIGFIIGIFSMSIKIGAIAILLLVPLGLLFDFIVSSTYKSSIEKGRAIPWWVGGRGRGGGGSFRGFGGGRSGGGGASGGW